MVEMSIPLNILYKIQIPSYDYIVVDDYITIPQRGNFCPHRFTIDFNKIILPTIFCQIAN
jgi:hypothetical protein